MTAEPPVGAHGAVDLSALAQPRDDSARAAEEVTDATFAEVVERSRRIPIILGLWAEVSPASVDLMALLADVAASYEGRLAFVRCDLQRNPGVAEALQASSVPAVVAILAGRPAPLFQGGASREQIASVYDQVIEIAASAMAGGEAGGEPAADASPPLTPAHEAALDAMERGDAAAAVDAFEKALGENPKDAAAKAGLAQARLIQRTDGADLAALIAAADADASSVNAALAAADAETVTGHPEAAFARLLDAISAHGGDDRERIRARLVDLFETVGGQDPRVVDARRRLASALN